MINRVIISGGGTGGHIFPAVAIADELKRRNPAIEILFVGAEGRMEMEKVPLAGYQIIGLPIAGLQRKLTLSNFMLPYKLAKSLLKARRIIKDFKPQLVVGVGGYASGPILKMANLLGIPTLIQEQNSFAGKTNKLLAQKARTICVAYDGMEAYFPAQKIVLTGNPVRKEMSRSEVSKIEAINFFKLDSSKKTILVIGGSLGARAINQALIHEITKWKSYDETIQVLWQCGKLYYDELKVKLAHADSKNIYLLEFIQRMDLAYAAADLVVSRAGALSVSELCLLGKASILVPSPNVAEDHQTKNAMALVRKDAAVMLKDDELKNKLISKVTELLGDENAIANLSKNSLLLAKPNATEEIVDECEKVTKQ
jgi:UDP-N-acetylglucosamine--N-acetylmuramyl-(pentapeptide) pyrophosphoryl-undecaprenol N-acetylglucosamine transferase